MEILELGQDWKIAALRDTFHVHFFIGDIMKYYKKYMDMAYEEAKKAFDIGEIPVGCVVVKNNEVLAVSHNLKEFNNCALDHAELICIREASKKLNNWRLDGCDIYITLEPCLMCASAIKQARVSNVFCGCSTNAFDHKMCNEVFSVVDRNGSVNFETDLDKERCEKILKNFFINRRNM